ncbi:LEA type 2 family protein, partial [bacterium]|nr:LEA type 2 family protein [bacterium]
MVRKSNGKISLIAILLVLFLIPIIYIGITYVSATSATYSISGVEFNEKILDLILNPQQAALSALISRQVEVDINLLVEGHGFLPATIKSLTAQLFLEDTYLGAIYTDEQFTIPPSDSTIVEFTVLLDLSQIGLDDIWRVANTIPTHNYEIKTAIQGDFELFLILFSLKIPMSATSYTLTLTDAPQVVGLVWDLTSCEVGDDVGFSVAV